MLYLYILSDKNKEIQRMYIGCIKSNISQNKASYKNIFVSQWWMSQNLKLIKSVQISNGTYLTTRHFKSNMYIHIYSHLKFSKIINIICNADIITKT
jgi:hypothetical protein